MNLHHLLQKRAANNNPVRVGLIGAGKFGSMYLAQVRRTTGIHLVAVADLSADRARNALVRTGWSDEIISANNIAEAMKAGTTCITEDAESLIKSDAIEVIIDATGSPAAGVKHVLLCCDYHKHIVMVNVEADAMAGPELAHRAAKAGIVYSLAYGDQPALICEMVDWARTAGFSVVAAGKGTKYLPAYHLSTPASVWDTYGFSEEQVKRGDFNAQMFNSFLDGTKSAIEMAAVANACNLAPAPEGLNFPPCGVDDLPHILKPRIAGGTLHHAGQVEVVSSLERDGRPVFRDLRWGVYVVFSAGDGYVEKCFSEYGLKTDASGRYAALYKPYHLIGLELGISVASVALRREATGSAQDFLGDAIATAKRDLKPGDMLDGEGGYTVYGTLVPATESMRLGALPIGLAHNVKVVRDVWMGNPVRWSDVDINDMAPHVKLRLEMEARFKKEWAAETV
jgi:predicted homoserine dehydrogenase-like protein